MKKIKITKKEIYPLNLKEEIYPFIKEGHIRGGGLVKDLVLGINDGLVSVVSLVSGVSGAAVGNQTVVLAGVAGAVAGALSMAFGTYIAHKSQIEFYKEEFKREKKEIRELPDVEKEEIRIIYKAKGFKGKQLENAVKTITSDKDVWLRVMMLEELGLAEEKFIDYKFASIAIGTAFIVASAIPIIPYVILPAQSATYASVGITSLALFAVGAFKTKFTHKTWWKSGMEMVLIGAAAATITYLIGALFQV
ncbi:MAG: VIT1/CCC1 transporter family protein [Candidatus Micrarchaeia archaeon]